MHIRRLAIGVAVLGLGASALAEPAKPAPQGPAQPTSKPAQVVLASAEQAPEQLPAAVQQQAPAPAKKRAARVTTCRCAGQSSDH